MCKKLLVENNSWHPGQRWLINGILLPKNRHEMCEAVILVWQNTAHPQADDVTLSQGFIHGGSHHWGTHCSPINNQWLDQRSGPQWISKPELPTSSSKDNPSQKIFWAAKATPCKSETRRRQAKNRGQPDCRSKPRRFQGIKQQSRDETNMKAKQVKSRSISQLNQGLSPHRHGRFSNINQLYWFRTAKAKSSLHQQKSGNKEWTDNATLTPKCRKISEFIRLPSDTTARGCSI